MLIPRNVFNISACCGDDVSRYPLDTVRLERDADGNPVAVATDGQRLMIAKWSDKHLSQDYYDASSGLANTTASPAFSVLVPVKNWDETSKAIPKKCKNAVLENALIPEGDVGKTIPLETRDDEGTVRRVAPKPPEGTFPDWREALPQYQILEPKAGSKEAVRIRVSATLLSEVAKTLAATAGKSCDYVDLVVPLNPLNALEFRSNAEEGIKVTSYIYPINEANYKPYSGALPSPKAAKETPVNAT